MSQDLSQRDLHYYCGLISSHCDGGLSQGPETSFFSSFILIRLYGYCKFIAQENHNWKCDTLGHHKFKEIQSP